MLNALLRNLNVASFIAISALSVTACSFGSTPVGQGSNSSTSKRRDGGADVDATTPSKRRVSTRTADARVEEQDDMDAGQDDQTDQDNGQNNGKDTAKRDAGGGDHKAAGGSSGSDKKPDDKKTDTNQDKTKDQKSTDAGMKSPPPADAGHRTGDASMGDAGNPIGNLEDLAKNSPSGRTQATINKFLMTLGSGDAPASSIKEFLTSINDEVNCKMNPLSYECITACQAVGTTCALCILEDDCRMTMLDICGVTALGGCIPRR